MLGNFVFDIDGTMAAGIGDYELDEKGKLLKDLLGEAFLERHTIMAMDYPHYVFPGLYALFRWLHAKGGRLFFFSSGWEKRNLEFAAEFMRRAFGQQANEVPYQVFSREHCIATHAMKEEEGKAYQSFFYGQRKKKLAGIVVPPQELPHTLLIDDDRSYMVKGEEYNLVCLQNPIQYLSSYEDKNKWPTEGEEPVLLDYSLREFIGFHQPYYLAGLLDSIFEVQAQEGITLAQAAKQVQIDREGEELSRKFNYPSSYRFSYFRRGLAILRALDPTLQFYFPAILREQYKDG